MRKGPGPSTQSSIIPFYTAFTATRCQPILARWNKWNKRNKVSYKTLYTPYITLYIMLYMPYSDIYIELLFPLFHLYFYIDFDNFLICKSGMK